MQAWASPKGRDVPPRQPAPERVQGVNVHGGLGEEVKMRELCIFLKRGGRGLRGGATLQNAAALTAPTGTGELAGTRPAGQPPPHRRARDPKPHREPPARRPPARAHLPWKPRKGAQPGRLRGASPRAAQLRPGHYSERRVPPATREGRPGRTRQDPAGRGARALRLVARRAATATGPSGSPRPPARSPAASLSNLRSLPVSATRHSRPPLQGVTGFLKKTLFPGRADCTQRKVSSPPTFSLRGERSLSGVRGGEQPTLRDYFAIGGERREKGVRRPCDVGKCSSTLKERRWRGR
ncbi:uncharacterized protein [Canis lupus baileyi]|uniref:uncharacterized protein n=1 Tax=Canis lupus baileyi TaxID=143281 RepID=UPI003B97C761